jgi:hypothetical protein
MSTRLLQYVAHPLVSFSPVIAIQGNGHSALIPVWDHLITIEPHPDGALYRDQVKVSARVLTPLLWMFAEIFHRHRQRRRRRLASHGFDYGDA